jgi:hypothetical protein
MEFNGTSTCWGLLRRTKQYWPAMRQEKLICERTSEGEKVMCSRCSGVFKKCYFYKHVKICQSPQKRIMPRALGVKTLVQPTPQNLTLSGKNYFSELIRTSTMPSSNQMMVFCKLVDTSFKQGSQRSIRMLK